MDFIRAHRGKEEQWEGCFSQNVTALKEIKRKFLDIVKPNGVIEQDDKDIFWAESKLNSLKKIEISQSRFQGHSGIKLLTSKRIP